ncbi:hypothetical protein HRbin30_00866 [bacterium HR30]|nr:hypothetical protein HRbin30_00866 [bacterium HR30]
MPSTVNRECAPIFYARLVPYATDSYPVRQDQVFAARARRSRANGLGTAHLYWNLLCWRAFR